MQTTETPTKYLQQLQCLWKKIICFLVKISSAYFNDHLGLLIRFDWLSTVSIVVPEQGVHHITFELCSSPSSGHFWKENFLSRKSIQKFHWKNFVRGMEHSKIQFYLFSKHWWQKTNIFSGSSYWTSSISGDVITYSKT